MFDKNVQPVSNSVQISKTNSKTCLLLLCSFALQSVEETSSLMSAIYCAAAATYHATFLHGKSSLVESLQPIKMPPWAEPRLIYNMAKMYLLKRRGVAEQTRSAHKSAVRKAACVTACVNV